MKWLFYAVFTLLFCVSADFARAMDNIPATATEDLMREHGVLGRILLIYEELSRRMDGGESPAEELIKSTRIIRNFIQDYHEKLEEEYIFKRLRGENKLVRMANILELQHNTGRKIIDEILRMKDPRDYQDKEKLDECTRNMRSFIRLYRPHKAQEDTFLFPEFKKILSAREYDELGGKFEEEEARLFGEGGFEKIVSQTEEIEKSIGIFELSQFTPK